MSTSRAEGSPDVSDVQPPRDAVVEAARHLFDFTQNRGHRYSPVKEADREVIAAANRSEPSRPPWSLDCWDCRGSHFDQRIDPYSETDLRTWADHDHEQFEAWQALREALDALD